MDEHNELRTRLRAVGMELFRRDGLRFTMQQAAAMMHISKKTIYAVYPSKEALLLDMVDHAFAKIHRCKPKKTRTGSPASSWTWKKATSISSWLTSAANTRFATALANGWMAARP